jgi:hypothetical protein
MNDIRQRRQNLRRLLIETHRQRQTGSALPTPPWRHRLMTRVAQVGDTSSRVDPWALMERLVWRFVPAACALTLLLAVWISQAGPDPAGEWSRIVSGETAVPGLYTYYQSESQNE